MSTRHVKTVDPAPAHPADTSSRAAWSSTPEQSLDAVSLTADPVNLAATVLAIVVTVFALQWAQNFFIPLLLGIIIAYTLNPVVAWLERTKIPRLVGTSLVMLALLGAGALAMLSLRGQMERILNQVPDAAREIEQAASQATDGSPAPQDPPARIVVEQPRFKVADLLWTGSLGMFGLIGDSVMLLFLVYFLLLSGDTFKRKLLRVTGPSLSKKKITVSILDDINRSVQNYMVTLLSANALLALLTWTTFHFMGMVKVFSEHVEDFQPLAELLGD